VTYNIQAQNKHQAQNKENFLFYRAPEAKRGFYLRGFPKLEETCDLTWNLTSITAKKKKKDLE
jgi:hypothetical protein